MGRWCGWAAILPRSGCPHPTHAAAASTRRLIHAFTQPSMMPDLVSTSRLELLGPGQHALDHSLVRWLHMAEQAPVLSPGCDEDLGARVHDGLQRFRVVAEIGDQHLDRAARLQPRMRSITMARYSRRQVVIVAGHRGDHRVPQVHGFDRLRTRSGSSQRWAGPRRA